MIELAHTHCLHAFSVGSTWEVANADVDMRESYSTGTTEICRMIKGERFQWLSETDTNHSGRWVRVRCSDGTTGWLPASIDGQPCLRPVVETRKYLCVGRSKRSLSLYLFVFRLCRQPSSNCTCPNVCLREQRVDQEGKSSGSEQERRMVRLQGH